MQQEDWDFGVSRQKLGHVQIYLDSQKKVLSLQGVVFSSHEILDSVKKYVDVRKNHYFKPHKTFFSQVSDQEIILVQEIPFSRKEDLSLRQEIDAFRLQMKRAHRLLFEIALEDHFERVQSSF